VVDWNGDGRPDLLVGDYTTQKPTRPEPTAKERAEHDRIRTELEAQGKRLGELLNKVRGPNRARKEEDVDKALNELQEVQQKIQQLQAKLPRDYEDHGWVWLFLRKPAPTKVSAK
jgi:hypothetical protein